MKSSEDVTTLVDTFETAYKSCMRFIYNLNDYCYKNQLLIDTRREDALHCFNLTPVNRNYKFSGPIEFGALEVFDSYISDGANMFGIFYDDNIERLKDFVKNESERQGCFIRLAYAASHDYPIYKVIEEEQRTQFLAEQNKISSGNTAHRLELTCNFDPFIDDVNKLLPFTFKVSGLVGLYSNNELRWDEDKIENSSIDQITVPVYWDKGTNHRALDTVFGINYDEYFNHANLVIPSDLIRLEKSISEEKNQVSSLYDLIDLKQDDNRHTKILYNSHRWFQVDKYNDVEGIDIQEPLNQLILNALGIDKSDDSKDDGSDAGVVVWNDFHNLTQLKDYQAVYGARLNEIMKAELSARFVVEMCRQMLLGHQIEVNGYTITVNEICTDPYEDGPTIIGIDDLGDEIEVGGPEMITVIN